ncbi:hypothetical protein V2J09_003629 [Rumex salicifolius]
MASSSQVPHKQLSLDIQVHSRFASAVRINTMGTKTDLVISSYEDHILVIATQIGSMGTILHARKELGLTTEPTFTASTIFGKRDEPMLVACARKLIEHISSSGSSKSLVLSLGLKNHSMELMKAIVAAVIDNRLW